MNSKDWKEKRENVRAAISTRVRIQRIDPKVAQQLRFSGKTTAAVHSESSGRNRIVPPPKSLKDFAQSSDPAVQSALAYLLDSIFVLNEKVDRVLNLLENKTNQNHIAVKEAVNISGTGLKLILFEPVKKDRLLDITIHIPGFPMDGFKTYGQVVWCKTVQDTEQAMYEVGIHFIDIREKERDLLIAYAFSQERQQIRQQKNQ